MTDKVAIFLDVENVSGWLKDGGGKILLEQANKRGKVVVRKAYGDFSHQSVNQRQAELSLLGFEFVHVYHSVKGKNSADIQIAVDAMEYFARMPDLQWFILVTGDSDFSPLFRRLRELGKSVVGVGPESPLSEAVKQSCSQFVYTDKKATDKKASGDKAAVLRKAALKTLKQALNKLPHGVKLSQAKLAMLSIDSTFDEKLLGFKQFKNFIQSAPSIGTLYKVNDILYVKKATPSK